MRWWADRQGWLGTRPPDHDDLAAQVGPILSLMAGWFGEPLHPQIPSLIRANPPTGLNGACRYVPLYQCFLINISPNVTRPHLRLCVLAHELFHRAVRWRKGVVEEMWANEMLARVVSHQVMIELGHSLRIAPQDDAYIEGLKQRIDVPALMVMKRKPGVYPDGFERDVHCLGIALREAVGWEALCRMVRCDSLDSWLALLDLAPRAMASRILQRPEWSSIPAPPLLYRQMATSLYCAGDWDGASEAAKGALAGTSEDFAMLSVMGVSHRKAGQLDSAIAAWREALIVAPNHAVTLYRLGDALVESGDYRSAAGYLRRAIGIRPGFALAHISLGCALEGLGLRSEARACWSNAVGFATTRAARESARRALDRHPAHGSLRVLPRRGFHITTA